MNIKLHLQRLLLPTIALSVSIGLVLYQAKLPGYFADSLSFSRFLTAAIYLAAAWVVSRVLAMILDQIAGNRPYPRLLKDLITAFLFVAAFVSVASL